MPSDYLGPFCTARLLLRGLFRLLRDHRGNIGVMTALLIVPLAGAFGLATEASGWFLVNRAEQSAADSAALAAASNNEAASGGIGYISEARAVASKYGFTNGSNNTTVSVSYQAVASVPNCVTTQCYVVTVTHDMPLYLSSIVGYTGNVALGSGRGESIQAAAIAIPKPGLVDYCITSGDGNGKGINPYSVTFNTLNGLGLAGCTVRARGAVACHNGSDGGAKAVVFNSFDNNMNCPANAQPTAPSQTDPFCCGAQSQLMKFNSQIRKNFQAIPNPCTNYPQEGNANGGANSLPNSNLLNQLTGIPSTPICGDVALSGNITLSAANNLLVIENGRLDLNGFSLTTAAGAGLTIAFSGTNTGNYSHFPTGNGTLDIAAPATGQWSGFAMAQDPNLTSGVDFTYSGNNPTWNLTGLVYLPKSQVTISGAFNSSSNGLSCFALLANVLTFNDTGSIFAKSESQCASAGITPPQGPGIIGAELVY